MKQKAVLIAPLIALLLLSGCLPTSILDDVLLVEAEGIDYLGNEKVMGTITMPNYVENPNPGSAGAGLPTTASMLRHLSGVTYDGKSLVDRFQQSGQMPIRVGKIRLMLFNTAMAKKGLYKQIDLRNRDPDSPRDMNFAVVEGSCRKLLTSADYQTQIPVARYIQDMIEQNTEQNYPESTMESFMYAYYGDYMDPFLPIIRKQGDHIAMHGLALFKNDKYVMRLSENRVFTFKMLFQKFNQGIYDYEFAPNKHIAFKNVHTDVNYKVKNGNSAAPDIYASVNVSAQVRQSYPKTLSKTTGPGMEKKLNKHMAKEAVQLVRRFQRKQIDPLQLGQHVRSYTRNFDGKSWPERYPNARFHCKVDVTIRQTGISE
ncbi:Ger(x)C family spore germination protein [Sporolactobacillus terrae]|uniref:Ger(x)C family spore germination protein n=1 Tax=Sporolactobacillus terrae TaxID=269673 RepID=UPI00111B2601|nr:Ger(x)C family spore germination protein [Sporolactobacillus terrae]